MTLGVSLSGLFCNKCCGSGSIRSVHFWSSGSVIICTDPDLDLDPDPSISKHKSKKNIDFYYFLLLFYFLSSKRCNVPSKNNKQKNFEKKLFFCWHLVSHWQKGSIRSRIRIRIRIRKSGVQIRGSGSVPKIAHWSGSVPKYHTVLRVRGWEGGGEGGPN